MSWSEGYVADAEYTSHYFPELAPAHLDFVALTAGVLPPARDQGQFRYCELGCGNGMSTNLLAAGHPRAQFVGIDFMPVHIANSRSVAKRGGLKNVQFLEMSFAEACEQNFEPFDYIVAHGVFSWISPQNRAEMVAFYRRFLAPGGIVYLSYNCQPGWSSVAPVQRMVSEFAHAQAGPSTQRVRAGFDFAKLLLEKNAISFAGSPAAKHQIEKASTMASNYLAQEYLNAEWHPTYVTEVMAELAPAKLSYVASATVAENDLRLLMTEDLAALVRAQPTEQLRQLVKDIATNARFRRDIYSRGGRQLSGLDQRQLIRACCFSLTRSPQLIKYELEYSGRKAGFDTPIARAVVGALAAGRITLEELSKECTMATDPLRSAAEVLGLLMASGQAMPVDARGEFQSGINKVLINAALEDTACNAVATASGSPLLVTPLELAILNAEPAGKSAQEIANAVFELAKRKGRVFNRAGETIKTDEEAKDFLLNEAKTYLAGRDQIFERLGLR